MSRPASMFQGTPVTAFTASRFHWPSDGIRRQVRAVKIPSAHVMFISLIRLAKPDSEIHLVRSFLFSQLFEGLTVSSSSRSNRMTKDRLLTKPQHDPRVGCSKAILTTGSTIHWLSFGIVQPAMQSASQAMAKLPYS